MSELRQNLITKEWVIIASERGERPEDFSDDQEEQELTAERSSKKDDCPFCPGNIEGEEANMIIPADDSWRVRIIPNDFPALNPEGEREGKISGVKRVQNGVGYHEVCIDSPKHNATIATLSDEEVEDILEAYQRRYNQLSKDDRVEQIIIFKNHGPDAGASLKHPHSQIIATPIVPLNIKEDFYETMRFYHDNCRCAYCQMMEEEVDAEERIIHKSGKFVSFIPYASEHPFSMYVIPRQHKSSFGNISATEKRDLAEHLRVVLGKVYQRLGDPDFNYIIKSVPLDIMETEHFHWNLRIIVRTNSQAGFELGSGMYINSSKPEESAKFLNNTGD